MRIAALTASSATPSPEKASMGSTHTYCPRSPRRQLPALHRRTRTPNPPICLAQPLLELPPQTAPGPAQPHHPGPARTQRRPLPLGQPPLARQRSQTTVHLPRLLRVRRRPGQRAGATGQLRPPAARPSSRGERRRRSDEMKVKSDDLTVADVLTAHFMCVPSGSNGRMSGRTRRSKTSGKA